MCVKSEIYCLSLEILENQGNTFGKISAQPHTTLCIQFLDRENNDKNNRLPLGKQICFTIVWGCAEILPYFLNENINDSLFIKLDKREGVLSDLTKPRLPSSFWISTWVDFSHVLGNV